MFYLYLFWYDTYPWEDQQYIKQKEKWFQYFMVLISILDTLPLWNFSKLKFENSNSFFQNNRDTTFIEQYIYIWYIQHNINPYFFLTERNPWDFIWIIRLTWKFHTVLSRPFRSRMTCSLDMGRRWGSAACRHRQSITSCRCVTSVRRLTSWSYKIYKIASCLYHSDQPSPAFVRTANVSLHCCNINQHIIDEPICFSNGKKFRSRQKEPAPIRKLTLASQGISLASQRISPASQGRLCY